MSLNVLKQAQKNGVLLYLDDHKLKARAVKGAMNATLKKAIATNKQSLVSLMSAQPLLNLSDEAIGAQQAYWQEQLSYTDGAWLMPGCEQATADELEHENKRQTHHTQIDSLAALDLLASKLSSSRFALLHCTLAALLGRYSGINDTVVGQHLCGGLVDITNSESSALEAQGFDNSVAIRLKLAQNATLADYVRLYRQTTKQALKNASLTEALIGEMLQANNETTGSNKEQGKLHLFSGYYRHNDEHLHAEQHGYDSHCDLSVAFVEQQDGLSINWHYNTAVISEALMQRFAANFATLLAAAIAQPDVDLDSLDALSELEYRQQVQLSEGPEDTRFQEYNAITERFAHWVLQTPNATAVVFNGQSLTYEQLDQKANQLAFHLLAQGIEADDVVAVALERAIEVIVVFIAILKAGGAYLPIDPAYPSERIEHMLTDSRAKLICTQSDVVDELAEFDITPLVIDKLAPIEPQALPKVSARQLAYIIYTSGSTGKPKGVALEHRGALNLYFNQLDILAVEPASKVAQFASISFDAATWEWLMALLTGSSLYICDDQTRTSAQLLADFLAVERITHVTLPPALLAHLDIERDYALQALVVAGEACDQVLAWRWAQRYPMFNGYGPSESTVCASIDRIETNQPLTIGKPLANFQLYVASESQNLLMPVGASGELLIGGVGLARGYLHNKTLTEASFGERALGQMASQRLYRTGDRVRLMPNGKLQFLGRIDNQIQLNGFRVELGEIEQVLQNHQAVKTALVMLDPHSSVKRLMAYVVVDAPLQDEALGTTLHEVTKQHLPEYMIPAAVMVMDAFPLTINGKIDSKQLPAADFRQLTGQQYVAPQTDIQRQLVEQWQQLLMVDRVGINDSFFALGGDSILSIQAVARANQQGIAMTTKDLLKWQTIEALSENLNSGEAQVLVSAPQHALSGQSALLPVQQAFLHKSQPDLHHFNQSIMLSVPSDFNQTMLIDILQAMMTRHDALRLGFKVDNDGQWTAQYQQFSRDDIEQCCLKVDHPQASFKLFGQPLIRAVLDTSANLLTLIVHHLVVDGMSWRILLGDIELAYAQLKRQQAVTLPPKTSAYQDWAQALNEYDDKYSDFWQPGHSTQGLKSDFDGADAHLQQYTQIQQLVLSEQQTALLLRDCHSSYNTSINELLLAAVLMAAEQWQGIEQLTVMLESHGREALFDTLDTGQTVGWFTSIYPLTFACHQGDIAGVIKATKEHYRTVPNNGIGYGLWAQRNPQLAKQHNAQLLFNYLGQFEQAINTDGGFAFAQGDMGPAVSPLHTRDHLLGINSVVNDGKLSVAVDFSTQQFNPDTIARLVSLLEQSLTEVIEHTLNAERCYTPSDFALATASQSELDSWQQDFDIDNLYPVTSMQQGLIYHTLIDAQAYNSQTDFTFIGVFNGPLFAQAWQEGLMQFDVMRSVFVGEQTTQHQLVVKGATLPWIEFDWRDLEKVQQEAQFDQYMAQDKQQGFDLQQPPLTRVSVFRLADDKTRVLWSHHHALLDGWSLPLVYSALMGRYDALVAGDHTPLADNQYVYQDYIAWLLAQDVEQAKQYWQDYLAGIEAPNSLGLDKTQGVAGSRVCQHLLGKAQTTAIRTLAQQHNSTVYTILQLAWAYILHKYSGDDEIVFGAITSGRPTEVLGIEQMVGLFINTMPVRVSFAANASLPEQLLTLQQQFARSSEYSYLGLRDIQKQSEVMAGVNLFESLLVLENYPLDAALEAENTSALKLDSVGASDETNYQLTLNCHMTDELSLRCSFNGNDFSDAWVDRLLAHLAQFLEILPHNAEYQTIGILTQTEQQQLAQFSAIGVESKHLWCIHQVFEQQVETQGNKTALVFNAEAMSYDELNQRANRLAHYLLAQGVKPDTLVGLYVERSFAMVIGILAILKAGGAYLPLDPGAPQSRLAHILQDSGVSEVLTQSALQHSIDKRDCQFVDIDDSAAFANFPSHNIDCQGLGLTPDHLAYVIYTSGSTGKPKGVLVEHRNVTRLLKTAEAHFDFNADDVWPLFHSVAFDVSVWELWGSLFYGGTLVVVPKAIAQSLDLFYQLTVEHQVTVLNQTPAAFEQYSQIDKLQQQDIALRYVIFAGAALDYGSLQPWVERHPLDRPQLINMYGITETTVHVTYKRVCDQDVFDVNGSPIGAPLADLCGYVLDRQMMRVPLGIVGELFVGGDGVTRGYLNRPELNAERFIDSPFIASERLYRSGDLVRQLADGEFEYVGRIDDQVKVRGFRIELPEIGYQLTALECVREALVLTSGSGNNMQLVAYVVLDNSTDLSDVDAQQIKDQLSATLPEYMVPASVMIIERFAMNVNGKIDKKALPAPEFNQSNVQYVAPVTQAQQIMAKVWEQVLEVEQVGLHDNFFAIGGDSIRAIPVVGKLKQQGFDLTIKNLLESATVAKLCEFCELQSDQGAAAAIVVEPFSLIDESRLQALENRAQLVDAYPMTRLQQGMVFHNLRSSSQSAYHDVMSFHVKSTWDEPRFLAAMSQLIRRHEMLRTLFYLDDEVSMQLVLEQVDAKVELVDIQHLDAAQQAEYLTKWISDEKTVQFDFSQPLWHVFIHLRNDNEFQYTLSFHHALFDGWSIATLNTELFNAFSGNEAQSAGTILPYRYFVEQEQRTLANDQNHSHWQNKMQGAQLPWWSGKDSGKTLRHDFVIDVEKTARIDAIAKQLGVPDRSVMLAVHTSLIALLSGKTDIITSVVVNARPELEGGERTLGLFLNTLPMRIKLEQSNWPELIGLVDSDMSASADMRGMPVYDIGQICGLDFSSSMFNYVSFHVYQQLNQDIEVLGADGFEETNFALSVNVSKSLAEQAHYDISLSVDEAIFGLDGATRMAHYFVAIVDGLLSGFEQPVMAGSYLPAPELQLYQGAPEVDFEATTLQHSFEQQVARTPDAVALIWQEQTFSYSEINNRANCLALQLQNNGVVAGTAVAVFLPRDVNLLVSLLAILKAGGFYVPLDPNYPQERTAAVVKQAAPAIVIASGDVGEVVFETNTQLLDITLVMNDYQSEVSYPEAQNLGHTPNAQQLAYAIFTSGSTGQPKGIAISHRNALSMVHWALSEYDVEQLAEVLAVTSICFDLSVFELFVPLSCGGSVVLVDNALDLMAQGQTLTPTLINTVPSAIDAMIRADKIPTTVKTINLAGEPLSRQLVDRLYQLPHVERVYNLYGPSEDTTYSTFALIAANSNDKPLIGKPIAGTTAYVLDEQLNLLPPGAPGELYLAGSGVSCGYLGQPQLTDTVYLDDKFAGSGRMYKTGDQVKMQPDGQLEYLGRQDSQIKIRGFRVELGDIEQTMLALPGVKEAVVVVNKAVENNDRLVAFYCLNEPQEELKSAISEHLRQHLPDHMQPAYLQALDAMPLMPNGKIDKNALPQPDFDNTVPYVEPQSGNEQQLALIWAELLHQEDTTISAQASFFELGGNSLLATRLVTALNRHFQLQLSLGQVFDHSQLTAMAALIEAEQVVAQNNQLLEASDDMMEMEW